MNSGKLKTRQNLETVLENLQQIEYVTRTKNNRTRILAYLHDTKQTATPSQIAKKIGMKPPTVRRDLSMLIKDGLVMRNDESYYWVSVQGSEYYLSTIKIRKTSPGSRN